MNEVIKNSVKIIFYLVLLFASISLILSLFACEGISYLGIRMASSTMRFPLGDLGDFAVFEDGRIACFCRDHVRVQIFSEEGQFLRGWFLFTPRGNIVNVRVDPNDQIYVINYENKHFVFNYNGDIIKESKGKGIYRHDPSLSKEHRRDSNGCYYEQKKLG